MAKKIKTLKEKETKLDKKLKSYVPFLAGLGVLVLVFLVLYFAFQGLGKVKYEGLTFVKERYGEVLVYHYNYFTKLSNGNLRNIDVFLRGNPAENNVSITGKIAYPEGKAVYLGINNSGLNECEDSVIALASLSGFLVNNNIPLKAGTSDKDEALENNSTYVTCQKYLTNMVIDLKSGEQTKITHKYGFCYEIEVSNCEILPAIEKFIVRSIIDAKDQGL